MSRSSKFFFFVLITLLKPAFAAEPLASDALTRDQIEKQLQSAREQLEKTSDRVAYLSLRLYGQSWSDIQSLTESRQPLAVLGIIVGLPVTGAGHPAGGVQILRVSPAGPAETAGLRVGDVIVSFGGKELNAKSPYPQQLQILELVREAKPGEPAIVGYQRDGKAQKTSIVPTSLPALLAAPVNQALNAAVNERNSAFGGDDLTGFGSAELLVLTPGLGRYFGTDKGLLVVRAPRSESLQLQDGDVILDVDGRVPNSAAQVLRILGSYGAGENVKVHIMRQLRRVELAIEIPRGDAHS